MKFVSTYWNYIKYGLILILTLSAFAWLQKHTSVEHIFEVGGVAALAATVFAETGLLIGFFLPGDTLLFAAGFFAAQDRINLLVTIISLFAAAVAGNMAGYEIGRRSGPRLFNKPDSILFHKANVDKAQDFFDKHGGKTVIFARFVPIVRTLSSPMAGISNMPYKQFMLYNVIGALLWVPTIVLIGYWAGKVLGRYINIDHYILPIVVAVTLLSLGISFAHILRDPQSREHLKKKFLSLKR